MQLDDVIYVYIIFRFNKETKTYRKLKIYFDAIYAMDKLNTYKVRNAQADKYEYRLERYRLTRIEDNDF